MKTHIIRFAGFVLFVVAFFLPAVRTPGTDSGSGPVAGWVCAMSALMASAGLAHLGSAFQGKEAISGIALILSGWVNPLLLLFLVFSIRRTWRRVRLGITAAIALCLVATWIYLWKAPMMPLVGHYLWVAGIVVVVGAEYL